MALELQAAAVRRTRRLVAGLVALVVILIVAVLVLLLRPSTQEASPPPTPTPAGSRAAGAPSTPTITPDLSFTAPTRWTSLPRSTRQKLGLPTGFPRTEQGAVAAAAAAAQYGTTWDADAADRAVQVYSLPAQREQRRAATRQAGAKNRQDHGLPGTGPLPAGSSLSAAVIGVAWDVVGGDTVQVAVLSRTTFTTPSGQQTLLVEAQQRMVWADGDWYSAAFAPDQAMPARPLADLGSAAFNDGGWTAIQQGSSG